MVPISSCFRLSAANLVALLQRAFLGLHIFVGLYQSPIDGLHLVDRVEDLLPESGVGDAAIIERLVHEALVDPDTCTLQQVLRKFSPEARVELWAESSEGVGVCRPGVIERELESCAGHKPLVVNRVVGVGGRCAAGEEVGGRRALAIEVEIAGDRGLKRFGSRSRATRGEGESGGTGTRSTRTDLRSTGPAAGAQRRRRAAQRVRDQPGGRAQWRCAGPRAQDVGVGDIQIVAGDGDVVVVLKSQRQRVREAQVDLAVLHQVGQAHRIGEAGLRDRRPLERLERIAGETGSRPGKIAVRGTQLQRLGQNRSRLAGKVRCLLFRMLGSGALHALLLLRKSRGHSSRSRSSITAATARSRACRPAYLPCERTSPAAQTHVSRTNACFISATAEAYGVPFFKTFGVPLRTQIYDLRTAFPCELHLTDSPVLRARGPVRSSNPACG